MDVIGFDLPQDEGHDLERLIELPYQLRGPDGPLAGAAGGADPRWIPPLRGETRRLLSRGNPLLARSGARAFLAVDADEALARCVAIDDPELIQDGERVGLIGFYEAASDEAAGMALDPALDWLRSRGLRRVWGPMDFSIWHAYRFMTRGFETEPFLGEPRNPAAYPEQLTRAGFAPVARWSSWDLARPHVEGMRQAAQAMLRPELAAEGYRFRPIDLGPGFERELEALFPVIRDGFSENFGYSPVPFEEFRAQFGGMRPFLIPQLALVGLDPAGKVLGFGYVYPDVGPALRALDGDEDRLSELPALIAQHPPKRLVFHTVVIRADVRKRGVVENGMSQTLDNVVEAGFGRIVGALAKEGPTFYDKTGAPTRDYALFGREL